MFENVIDVDTSTSGHTTVYLSAICQILNSSSAPKDTRPQKNNHAKNFKKKKNLIVLDTAMELAKKE
jgi:hypothetical protein